MSTRIRENWNWITPGLVMDEIEKDFEQKFVAFAYEDVCRAVFADLCRNREIPFTPSRIGAYWLNDLDSDTEIDVMAVDHQNHQVFAGECKFHVKPVDAPVFLCPAGQSAGVRRNPISIQRLSVPLRGVFQERLYSTAA